MDYNIVSIEYAQPIVHEIPEIEHTFAQRNGSGIFVPRRMSVISVGDGKFVTVGFYAKT
jgi:hypothetical protein